MAAGEVVVNCRQISWSGGRIHETGKVDRPPLGHALLPSNRQGPIDEWVACSGFDEPVLASPLGGGG